MSSRQTVSDHGDSVPLQNSHFKPNAASEASSSSLPSMTDVLLQAGIENTIDNGCQYFAGKEHATDDNYHFPNSLFRTGTGKRVNISANGLLRAMALLGLEEDALDCDSQGLQQTTKLCAIDDTNELQHSAQAQLGKGVNSYRMMNVVSHSSPSLINNIRSIGDIFSTKNDSNINPIQPETYSFTSKEVSLKFSDRSISVSNDALQRPRRFPGDPDLGCFFHEGDAGNSIFSFVEERQSESSSICEGNDPQTPLVHHVTAKSKYMTISFTSPVKSSDQMEYSTKFPTLGTGNNLIAKFNAVRKEVDCLQSHINCQQRSLNDNNQVLDTILSSRIVPPGKSSSQTSVDMSNSMFTSHTNYRQPTGLKRRLGSLFTVSPLKKPRSCKFSAPLNEDVAVFPNGFSKLSSNNYSYKRKISTRYPFKTPRMHIGEFFGMPLSEQKMLEHFPDHLRQVTSGNAEKYVFHDGSGVIGLASEAFFHKLARTGASSDYATKEWIMNHCKWIVWKLACYERCYPGRSAGNFLTTSNVLEELKYRYEREVNHGHRSVIKKILEGGASYSSMMILCISAIHPYQSMEIEVSSETKHWPESSAEIKVELTDGWYSITAILDAPLSKKLAAGKLFVGQKLRIWGAGLSGWTGPVSPLEVPTSVCLLLHMNGTYRAHWAEKLGLCEHAGPPIAFRCIKVNGGLIPQTLAGITRIYPLLYMLSDGKTVLRSEMMETNMMQLDNQRCTDVMEGISSNLQEETLHIYDDESKGAQISNMLDTAADPEFLIADTSHEQLNSFVAYKEKLKAIGQSNTVKSNEQALKDAGWGKRDAIQFMRVRVVGLTQKDREDMPREGLVTIWYPTEKQRQELVEGQAYLITGLTPSSSGSDVLHLQATGSCTKWSPLSSGAREPFKPFFNCRKPISISSLIDIPLSSEFDTAAYIVHVGDVYTAGHQKTQWVFVIDGSMSSVKFGQTTSLLAICFCSHSQSPDNDLIPPISYNLVGSTVGFCNLTKKEKDLMNHIWIAKATENSTYYLTFDSPHCSHLMHTATSVKRWAINSSLTIGKVKEKILAAVANCKTE
ncbi:hypothetical protein QN277_007832 [Acacia crassicarpa]|uniref:Breast cancer type 2 susceptibility protein n=1 Tax=Acacia crassicarpa TaxID=499986 RepID=A0AAE1IY73_9FABA|nr:hypothetical protein QN277_007832 [Acacia crassicarpa]